MVEVVAQELPDHVSCITRTEPLAANKLGTDGTYPGFRTSTDGSRTPQNRPHPSPYHFRYPQQNKPNSSYCTYISVLGMFLQEHFSDLQDPIPDPNPLAGRPAHLSSLQGNLEREIGN
jgi:hypothetical protein